ncbi:hypothetical protein PIB30_090523 [Stylosanthes scabra]|uniref:Reverse transcriptase domain-containing protein n=1 Tax=Stylosanthes scabra TaxID=79078 RepID=A0ABU6RUZ6_9FABA|nr:hypothetical protein [Stylosanthes scabra]
MEDFRLFLQEQRVYQKQQATQMANLTEILADDDEEEFLKMLEEISMKDDVRFEESEGIIKLGDGNMEDEFDSIPEKLSDHGPCMVKDLMFPVDFYILDMPPDTPGKPSHVLLGRPFLKTARLKLDAFEGTFSFESNGICATFTMGDFIEEKVEEHPILWCELNKTVVVSTLEAKPEKLIKGKASQDGVLNATTTLSTHSKDNVLVSSEGLRYVPLP